MQDRKLAAIMFADIVSYSRLMGTNESEALKLLDDFDKISGKIIDKFSGTIIKKNGDGIFCEFTSAKNAVDASLELQNELSNYNDSRPKDFKLEVRIGIHIGDVVKKDNDIFGDGVNVAARIQPLASPGGICVSGAVSESLSSHPDYDIISKGEQELKNILQKHTIFQIKTGHESIEPVAVKKTKEKSSNTKYWLVAAPFIFILFIFLMNKLAFNIMGNMMNMEEAMADSENNPDILLFGDVFSDEENIEDIRWFYSAEHGVGLPDDLELISISRTDLDNIYDELLSSIEVNIFISNIDIDTKYDLDKFYKEKNDLVPDYKLKVFNFMKKIAMGEVDFSKLADVESPTFKAFSDVLINSSFYIMGQYDQVELGYFPVIYKLSHPYEGNNYLVVSHVKYDKDPSENTQYDSKINVKLTKEAGVVSELTNMLSSALSKILADNNSLANIKTGKIQISKAKGDKILFQFSNQDDRLKARMILDVYRDYMNTTDMFTQNEYLHRSLDVDSKSDTDNLQLEKIAKRRFDDLREYKKKLDKNKDSKQYADFYDRDKAFAFNNIQEYESLLDKTHALYTVTKTTKISFILPLEISVKVDEVFDSTGAATIYKKENPFQVLKEGDILTFK